MELEKIGPEDFEHYLTEWLDDDSIRNILVRGYFDKEKLVAVLYAIMLDENMRKGVLVQGGMKKAKLRDNLENAINTIKNLDHVNPENSMSFINSTTKWYQDIEFSFGQDCDFALFYPVQIAISERFASKFLRKVNNSQASKNILITTNDVTRDPEILYDAMDRVISLDLEDYFEKNRKELEAIEANLDGKPLPY